MTARGVIFVRHAKPEVVPGLAARPWGLSDAAREDCVLLAHGLPANAGANAWTSTEPKAVETATVIALRRGGQVFQDAAFCEADRPAAWDDDYQGAATGYLQSGEREGWEPRKHVVARFEQGVQRVLASSEERWPLVVTHGLALTLFLASVADIHPVSFWLDLTLPDAWQWDSEAAVLSRLYAGGTGST